MALVRYLCEDARVRGGEAALQALLLDGNNKGATAYVSACWFHEPEVMRELRQHYTFAALMRPTESGEGRRGRCMCVVAGCVAGGLPAGVMRHACSRGCTGWLEGCCTVLHSKQQPGDLPSSRSCSDGCIIARRCAV